MTKDQETLQDFKKRYDSLTSVLYARLLDAMPAIGNANFAALDKFKAWHFLQALNSRCYGDVRDRLDLKADTPNEAINIPGTIDLMMAYCIQQENKNPSSVHWVGKGTAPTGNVPPAKKKYSGPPCTNQVCVQAGSSASHATSTCNRTGGAAYQKPKGDQKAATGRGDGGRGNGGRGGRGGDTGRDRGKGRGGRTHVVLAGEDPLPCAEQALFDSMGIEQGGGGSRE